MTFRQTDRLAFRQTEREITDRLADGQTGRQTYRLCEQTGRQTGELTDRQTYRLLDRLEGRQLNRLIDRHAHILAVWATFSKNWAKF